MRLILLIVPILQPSAIASDDRHPNTAPHTPEPESDGEVELGEDELMDEDDIAGTTVSVMTLGGWTFFG